MGLLMCACQPDQVQPVSQTDHATVLASGGTEDPHPEWSPDCSGRDTFYLKKPGGTEYVDYCGFLPCSGQQARWGFVEVYNTDSLIVLNHYLATGWFVDLYSSRVAAQSSFTLDQNGVPVTEVNWLNVDVNPLVNLWQTVVPLDSLDPCFAIASKNDVLLLDFLGNPDPSSRATVWQYNPDFDNMANPSQNTASSWLTGWCTVNCGPVVTTQTAGECRRCESENTVEFVDCDQINVSSCKDLSNVVLVYDDCTWQKFDGLRGKTGSFAGTGAHAGKTISHVYIKSGCYRSGEGPGFGRRFDGPCLNIGC